MNPVPCRKKIGKHLSFVFVLACLVAPSQRVTAEDIAGDWEITQDFNGRQVFASLSLAKKADGALTGKWGSTELSDVQFDGKKLTFARTMKRADREFTTNFEGTLTDGKLVGKLTSDRGESVATGTRAKPKSPALGQWELNYRIGERDVTAKLSVSQKPDGMLEATWTSGFGESVISNVTFQNGKLTFSRKIKFNDRDMESTFEGTVTGNKLAGTNKSERGEIAVSGQRLGAALIGKWELTTTSDRGPRTSVLKVYGDMTGRYETFGGEIPIKDLKLEGNQVSFKVEMGFGDRATEMEFKGKVDGTTLTGESTTPNGTREVTGKKVVEAASQASALVGTWELEVVSSRGTRTNTLTVKEDMTGTYKARDTETPIADLKVQGDQVTFGFTRTVNDQEVKMEFKGKLEGATLKGQLTSPRGTSEVTGKKT